MMHLTISSFGGFTEQGFPDCNPSPDCYPNHRAQHHHSPLNKLFNKYCSDKGSYWLSKCRCHERAPEHLTSRVANNACADA
eukprot:6213948-Pleurochrysis_carterae.AAC.3